MYKLTALIGIACSVSSLASATNVEPYIVNGSQADVVNFPATASLFFDSAEFDNKFYPDSYCGGTILDDNHILTAAHCVYDDEAARLFTVVVPQLQNESDFPSAGYIQRHRVSQIFYPSNYIDSSVELYPNDIAILKLETSLNLGISVNRASNEDYRHLRGTFTAVGHGNTVTGHDLDDRLLQTNLDAVENSTCQSVFVNGDTKITNKQLCFSGAFNNDTNLSNSTCNGDSGGPVYWSDGGILYQVGITSFGPKNCGTGPVTSVFTEITDYASWINRVLNGSESPSMTATDAERQAHIDQYGKITFISASEANTTVSSQESGGGTLGWLSLLALLGLVTRKGRYSS